MLRAGEGELEQERRTAELLLEADGHPFRNMIVSLPPGQLESRSFLAGTGL